jgi:hypothetical protein
MPSGEPAIYPENGHIRLGSLHFLEVKNVQLYLSSLEKERGSLRGYR